MPLKFSCANSRKNSAEREGKGEREAKRRKLILVTAFPRCLCASWILSGNERKFLPLRRTIDRLQEINDLILIRQAQYEKIIKWIVVRSFLQLTNKFTDRLGSIATSLSLSFLVSLRGCVSSCIVLSALHSFRALLAFPHQEEVTTCNLDRYRSHHHRFQECRNKHCQILSRSNLQELNVY